MCLYKTKLESLESNLKKMFNEEQLFLLKADKPNNIGYAWQNHTIKTCSQILYACGKSGYEFLRDLGFPMPCLRTLQSKSSKLPFQEGVLYTLSPHLSEKVKTFSEEEKQCGVLLDEMSITPGQIYNPSSKSFVGSKENDKALVIILRGISTNWKLERAYFFTNSKGYQGSFYKSLLFDIIIDAESCGLFVRFISSDMGAANLQFWAEVGIKTDGSTFFFIHPLDPNRRIYVIADPEHLLKNITGIYA